MSRTQSIEAEQSILGRLLVDNAAFDRVGDLLTEADFTKPAHKLLYGTLARLINSGKGVDVVEVFEALKSRSIESEAGGLAYINELAQSAYVTGNVRRHAEIVREASILRDTLAKIEQAQEIAIGSGALAEKLDKVAALFSGMDAGNSSRKPKPMSDVMVRVIDSINEAAEGKKVGWRTGIYGIDSRLNGGLKPGKLYVLAARPAVGKTSLTIQIEKRIAQDGHPALMLSQEMEDEELGARSLSGHARVSFGNIQTGKLNDEEWTRIADGVDELAQIPFWIDDEPALSIHAINSKARYVKGLAVLAVDYIQLCEGDGDNRTQQVGSITRGLKKLAKQLGIAVIALSQLNREVDKRPGRRPQMSDLRDSGEIEQDADVIVFLWPLCDSEDEAELRHIGCEIAKNRQGKKGAMVLTLDGAKQLWAESARTIDSFGGNTKSRSSFE
ncbi:replicative DNA helicase [Roseateles sp. PN1]|uniref:replicative DNA helicase n=1 Tax=Roseateles sp. PN1 TaxID=3137372 RepID=UPI00313A11CC